MPPTESNALSPISSNGIGSRSGEHCTTAGAATTVSSDHKSQLKRILGQTLHHVKHHIGVGVVCAVAYFDPGNWSVDLQAGSSFGYRPMLFIILSAGLGAVLFQTLACKLGVVTGIDLASHCRLLLHNHPRHPLLVRRLVLYPLYVLSEIAIISTDLAELLGSATGLCLIFPSLPLWGGVVITAADVLIFLALGDPTKGHGRPVKLFEYTIILLVSAVFICFMILLIRIKPHWPEVFLGFVPSKKLFAQNPDAVYTAVSIIGATIMPHALFLGSFMATQDRVSAAPLPHLPILSEHSTKPIVRLRSAIRSLFQVSPADRVAALRDYRTRYGQRENNSLEFISRHLTNAIIDVVTSLMIIAMPINAAILVITATVLHSDETASAPAGLFDAHELIKSRIAAAFIFAFSLVLAAQAASITGTFSGQLVSEGFIEWRMTPFLRRLVTRLICLIPAVAVAASVGRRGVDTLLVASQVILSVVLPFVAFPLIYLSSSTKVMRVTLPVQSEQVEALKVDDKDPCNWAEISPPSVDFSNKYWVTGLSYGVWLLVLCANIYALTQLAQK